MNASGWSLNLLGQHVSMLLDMPRFMCTHFEYSLSLLSCGCMCAMLSIRMARFISVCRCGHSI